MATVLGKLAARVRCLTRDRRGGAPADRQTTAPSRLRRTLAQIALVLGMTGLLGGSVELGLRFLFPGKVLEAQAEHQRFLNTAFRFDPDSMVGLKPNMDKEFRRSPINGGEVVRWRTNSQGYRGPEFQSDPDVRVVVYGDSNVQAEFSELENTFVHKLQMDLRALSKLNVEVINAGIVGSGPDQAMIRMGKEAAALHPDIVVFHVFADNDFGDLVRNRLFELDAAGKLARSDAQIGIDSELVDHSGELMIVRAARRAGKALFGPAAVGATAEDQIRDLRSISQQEFSSYRNRGKPPFSHFADHYDIDIAIDPAGEAARQEIGLMAAVLRQANAVAIRRGIWLMVLVEPSATDMTENEVVSFKDLGRFPSYDRLRLTRVVDDICRRASIPELDLWPAFEASQPAQLYFRLDDDHWTDAGQEVAAREVAKYIFAERLARNRPGAQPAIADKQP